ncbi:mitogen-activated protein kinase 4-like [Rutidosis leptorrhynchoides]|uniref:mitogen-activated protein kinase 4-like n=1 Tax=Rutidosis leptorrhynchoides TaxID=125765 RepID=UPI003A98E982
MATPVEHLNHRMGLDHKGSVTLQYGRHCLKLILNTCPLSLLAEELMAFQREEEIEFIDNPKSRTSIKSFPFPHGTSCSLLYPHAHPLAVDSLQKMLVFDPCKRISVIEALHHPYMCSLYDPRTDPPGHGPLDMDIDDELGEV